MSGPEKSARTRAHGTPRGGGIALAALAVGAAALGCTKVQPPPPPPPPAPEAVPAQPASAARPAAPRPQALPERQWGTQRAAAARRQGLLEAPDTLNGDPGGLRREQLQEVMQGSLGEIAKCFANSEAQGAMVTFEAGPDGSPRGVMVRGAPEAATCIRDIVQNVRFPRFSGNPVPIDYPISVHRKTETVPAPPPAQDGTPTPATGG